MFISLANENVKVTIVRKRSLQQQVQDIKLGGSPMQLPTGPLQGVDAL